MERTMKDQRTYSAGEKGRNRVRVFPDPKTGMYQLEYRSGRRRESRSLKHRDFQKAKAQAEKLAANLPALEAEPENAPEPEPLTLGKLFEMYLEEVTPSKSPKSQKFDRAAVRRLLAVLGSARVPGQLSRREWDMFIRDRQSGRSTGRQVGPRTVARDLKFLLAVLNWAALASDNNGGVLLDRNPLKGLPIPKEKNPARPTLSDSEYQAMLEVAERVNPMLPALLVLAHETGHRIGAIRTLRWSDVDLEEGRVRWRAENDKSGREHVTPLTAVAVQALRRHRSVRPGIGDSFVFPAPKDSSKALSRHLVRDWWRMTERHAGLEHVEGRGWHSLRRQFASEMLHLPPKVLCELGGWHDYDTVLECYQHPDEGVLRNALAQRKQAAAGRQ